MITIFFFMHPYPYLKKALSYFPFCLVMLAPHTTWVSFESLRRVVYPGEMLKGFIVTSISQKLPKGNGYNGMM